MKLPGIEKAAVSETKIVKYLLSATHRAGKSKAAVFREFEYDPARSEEVDRALRRHATDNEVALEQWTNFVTRYFIDGLSLHAPDGRAVNVRATRSIDNVGDVPGFITAHPLGRIRL